MDAGIQEATLISEATGDRGLNETLAGEYGGNGFNIYSMYVRGRISRMW